MHICIFSNIHQYLSIYVLEDIYTHYIVLVYAIYIYIFITNTNICIYYYSCLWKPIPKKDNQVGFPIIRLIPTHLYNAHRYIHIQIYITIPSTLHTYVYIFYLPSARIYMFPQTRTYSTRTTIQHRHRDKTTSHTSSFK